MPCLQNRTQILPLILSDPKKALPAKQKIEQNITESEI
jgi:hypothetical protein